MTKYRTIALVGESGVGKTSLANDLVSHFGNTYHKVVTATSREKRNGEIHGIDYFYYTKEDFLNKIKNNEFIESAKYNSNYYGTPISSFEKNKINIIVVEPSGIQNLYNSQHIDLVGVVNLKRDYTLITSIADEKRIREITSRRISGQDEKEMAKIPEHIKKQFITLVNDSPDIRFTTLAFNKCFNMDTLVNLYDYDIKTFLKDNISILEKASKKNNKESLSFLFKVLINDGNELLKSIENNTDKNSLSFMSKLNIYMDNLEILKTFDKNKNLFSNIIANNPNIEAYGVLEIVKNFKTIQDFYNQNESKWDEKNKFVYKILENYINKLKDNPKYIDATIFRNIDIYLEKLNIYKDVLKKKITNDVVLNSSYLVDYAHVQFNKYNKKNLRLSLDAAKKDFLKNDIIYKLFFNIGAKQNIDVALDDNNSFVLHKKGIPVIVFDENKNKTLSLSLDENAILQQIVDKKLKPEELTYKSQTVSLFKKLIENDLVDDKFNFELYIKDDSIKSELKNILLRQSLDNNLQMP